MTLDYGKIPEQDKSRTTKNPYAGISVQDMLQKEAKAQFDGSVARYPVPDNMPKLYRIYGQVDMSLSKKPKETFISEIFNKQKHPNHKRPGPNEYAFDKAYDFATQHSSKRFQWNKQ